VDFEQLTAHFKRLTATLTAKQLTTLAFVFVAVVGVVAGSAYWVNAPSYSLLFSDMDAESASSVVTKLKNDKVPYQLDAGGKTIRVASDRVDELRLQFASSSAMPASGRIGFEIFDRTAFGTTEFLEHVNYRRALEGELARTISTISEVASARVHIAMAKDSLFSGDAQPAKASVVLKLRGNRPPAASTVNGIAGLLAASVESLRPEAVVILDTFGRPLSKPGEEPEEAGAGLPVEKQPRIERDLATRVVALLEPVVGSGRVRVNVSARLNANSEEQTEERWDPTTVVRSKQLSADTGGALSSTQGIAGARANAPPNSTTAPKVPAVATPAPLTASRTNEVTNFEVSKLTRHTIAPRGQLARLSVAVILDDERASAKDTAGQTKTTNKPRTPAEIQRIHGLVAAAVGLDTERGDQLTVENIAFEETPLDEPMPPAGWWPKVGQPVVEGVRANALEYVRMGMVMLLGLIAIFAVLKPMARRALKLPNAQLLTAPSLAAAGARPVRTVADLEGEIEAELDADTLAKAGELRRLPVLTKRIAKVADQQPEHVARLVRSWLADEEK
jgi:flagellar M-ring protein FliF